MLIAPHSTISVTTLYTALVRKMFRNIMSDITSMEGPWTMGATLMDAETKAASVKSTATIIKLSSIIMIATNASSRTTVTTLA